MKQKNHEAIPHPSPRETGARRPSDAVAMLSPSRSLGYRPDVTYSGRFSIGVDVLAWDNGIDQAFGPFWYAQNLQLGAVYQIKKLHQLGFSRNRDRPSFPSVSET